MLPSVLYPDVLHTAYMINAADLPKLDSTTVRLGSTRLPTSFARSLVCLQAITSLGSIHCHGGQCRQHQGGPHSLPPLPQQVNCHLSTYRPRHAELTAAALKTSGCTYCLRCGHTPLDQSTCEELNALRSLLQAGHQCLALHSAIQGKTIWHRRVKCLEHER